MPTKKILIAVLIIIVAVGGFVAGLYLLRGSQDIRDEAAIPTGQAEVSISPETGNFNVGDDIRTSIYFNPANIPINGVAVQLSYPYSGSSPEVTVSSIEINPTIENDSNWTCPTRSNEASEGLVVIEIGCGNTSSGGYVANNDTLLATITLNVNRAPSVSPLQIEFDAANSLITRKSDNQDILLIPSSTGSYTIAGSGTQITPTPTATVAPQASPTPTKAVTPTLSSTPTPTKAATLTPTPTKVVGKGGEEQLPDAGVGYPTIFGVGLGLMVIIGAMLLAI